MAYVVNEPKVGQRVYRHGKPQTAGVIKAVLGETTDELAYRIRVKWVNGIVEETDTWGLKDFDALIEDHRKKLKSHLTTLKKLEAL
jgi:uncharacterized protein YneR